MCSEERRTHTRRSPSLGVRGILTYQRCRGTVRFPYQMAWRLWGQQASMCNAAQPVWMSANISHQLPSTWDIRWDFTDPVAMWIQVAVSFPGMKRFVCFWVTTAVFSWRTRTAHLFIYLVWAGSPTGELNRQTHRKTEVEVDYSVCSFPLSHQWMFNVLELIKFPILFFLPSLPYVSSWAEIEGCTRCTSCTVQCRRKGGILYVAVES